MPREISEGTGDGGRGQGGLKSSVYPNPSGVDDNVGLSCSAGE